MRQTLKPDIREGFRVHGIIPRPLHFHLFWPVSGLKLFKHWFETNHPTFPCKIHSGIQGITRPKTLVTVAGAAHVGSFG